MIRLDFFYKKMDEIDNSEYTNALDFVRKQLGFDPLDHSFCTDRINNLINKNTDLESKIKTVSNVTTKFNLKIYESNDFINNLIKNFKKDEFLVFEHKKSNSGNFLFGIKKTSGSKYYLFDFNNNTKKKVSHFKLKRMFNKIKINFLRFEKFDHLGKTSNKSPIRRLLSIFKNDKTDIIILLLYSFLIGLLSLVIPISVQALVNTLAFGVLTQPLFVLTFIVMGILVFSSVLRGMRYIMVEILQQRIFARISLTFSYRLSILSQDTFNKAYIPEIVNRFFDIVTVQKSASVLLIDGISITLQTVFGLLLVSLYHPILLGFDVILILCILFVLFVLGVGSVKTSIKESKVKYETAAWLEEIARNNTSFRANKSFIFAFDKTNQIIKKYLKYRKNHFHILLRQIVGMMTIQTFAISLLLGIGGWLVIKGELTLGQLIAAEIIIASIVANLIKFGKHLETFYDLMAAVDKLGYLMDLPIENRHNMGKVEIEDPKYLNINIANLVYFNDKEKILDNINFKINDGEFVSIIGDDGSGKSTIGDILYGLRSFSEGIVEYNQVDIRSINLSSLRDNIGIARNIEIFDGTIDENLRVGDYSLQKLDIIFVLKELGIYQKIMGLPNGLQTYIYPGQIIFSESQSFLLMLARVILHNPKLIIVDELFDKVTRKEAKKAIDYLKSKKTSLLVLTKSSYINNLSDKSIYLTDGKVVKDNDR